MNTYKQAIAERLSDAEQALRTRCLEVERTQGRVAAIKLYRTESGASLKTAMAALRESSR